MPDDQKREVEGKAGEGALPDELPPKSEGRLNLDVLAFDLAWEWCSFPEFIPADRVYATL
jgi:hypothetical protein